MTESIAQMIPALALVLLLIAALAFVYRKKNKSGGIVSIISYQSLGQKVGIAVLKIGGEIMVFGINPTDFKLLKKIDDRIPNQQDSGCSNDSFHTGRPAGNGTGDCMESPVNNITVSGGVAGILDRLRRIRVELNG